MCLYMKEIIVYILVNDYSLKTMGEKMTLMETIQRMLLEEIGGKVLIFYLKASSW